MDEWIDIIEYRDFSDTPRIFVIGVNKHLYLFDCRFREELDDYDESYDVFELTHTSIRELPKDWTSLPDDGMLHKGSVPVSEVVFDETHRRRIKRLSIEHLIV